MNDATYRLAARIAVARQLRGRPVPVAEPARALLARWQALSRLHSGRGMATLPPAAAPAPQSGSSGGSNGGRTAPVVRDSALGMRSKTLHLAGSGRPSPTPVGRSIGADAKGVGRGALAGFYQVPLAGTAPRLAVAMPGRANGRGSVGLKPALTRVLAEAPRRVAAIAMPGMSARVRHEIAAPVPQPSVAPGFHRTVRQPQAKAAAGNVYLDKTLVGYHLAAAITAEQTRAATRPNGSGSSFNSSMAALRPSGAGL